MPPTRRTSNTPPPKGRRPKVAGTGPAGSRKAAAAPVEEVREPEVAATQSLDPEPATTTPAVAATEPTPEVEVEIPAGASVDTPDAAEGAGAAAEPELPRKKINRTSALRPRGASESAGAAAEAATGPGESDRGAWKPVVVVGAVAVVLGAFAVVAAFEPGADVSNRAWVDTSATSKVTADAKHAIETLYTYKFDTVDQDFDNARAVLTDNMRTEFDKTAKVTRDAVVQTKTATSAQVTDIGAKLLSDDKAELVASMNVSASNDGQAQGSAEGPLSVTMTKVGDTWLLSDIRDR
ncbi:hypothetical protein FK531_12940 [Rhodococcus spelaei]|uniref:Mce-associated membrane protein n=1 Tax=Rhodococcus spelaei TaxID=2546320 RepID=A0A541B8S0_9NOCA|nr:hypothetical protein [Rhodococcus spelaei]TQF68706.1 hypothetical protein FK531_12940 [Rhodococcus spelaei]